MNSQTLYINSELYSSRLHAESIEKSFSGSFNPVEKLTPIPIKKIIVSFWKVWTAKID